MKKKIDTKPSDEYFNMRIKGVEDENKTVVQPSHPFQLPIKLPVNKEKNDAPVSPKITTIVKSDDVITNGKKEHDDSEHQHNYKTPVAGEN